MSIYLFSFLREQIPIQTGAKINKLPAIPKIFDSIHKYFYVLQGSIGVHTMAEVGNMVLTKL